MSKRKQAPITIVNPIHTDNNEKDNPSLTTIEKHWILLAKNICPSSKGTKARIQTFILQQTSKLSEACKDQINLALFHTHQNHNKVKQDYYNLVNTTQTLHFEPNPNFPTSINNICNIAVQTFKQHATHLDRERVAELALAHALIKNKFNCVIQPDNKLSISNGDNVVQKQALLGPFPSTPYYTSRPDIIVYHKDATIIIEIKLDQSIELNTILQLERYLHAHFTSNPSSKPDKLWGIIINFPSKRSNFAIQAFSYNHTHSHKNS